MDARNPWDRQRDAQGNLEPMLWYERFERYRLMGPNRTIEAAWRESPAKGSKGKRPSRHWYERAREWRWKERAEAWDVAEAQRQRAEREAEERRLRAEARDVRRNLLAAGHNVLARAMLIYMGKQGAVADPQTAQRLLAAIARYNADSREEYGDLPARDLNVRGKDGGPLAVVAVTATLEDLSDDELRRIIGLPERPATAGEVGDDAEER